MKKESLFQFKLKKTQKEIHNLSKIEKISDQMEKKVSCFCSEENLNSEKLKLIKKKKESSQKIKFKNNFFKEIEKKLKILDIKSHIFKKKN
jgi:hypothetical protein